MIEPIVQDYVEAAQKLACEAFCRQVTAPVLVTAAPALDQAFQSAPTRMLDDEIRLVLSGGQGLHHQSRVLDLQPRRPNRLGQVSIGRSEDNDLVLVDETVSSHHAIYSPEPRSGRPTIQDQESTNGSFINGRQLLPYRNALLSDGDVVAFGDAAFLFYLPAGLYIALRQLEPA